MTVDSISESAAKLATVLLLIQSTFQTLAPSRCVRSYGMKGQVSPMMRFVSEGTGTVTLSWAVSMYLIFFCNFDREQGDPLMAVGMSLVATIYHNAKALATNVPRALDIPAAGQWTSLSIKLAAKAAILSESSHARIVAKVFALFGILSGTKLALAPQRAARDWGSHVSSDPRTECLLRVLGQNVVGYAVFIGCLAFYVAPSKALGICIVPSLLSNIHLSCLSTVYDRAGVNKDAILAWMVVGALLTAVLILDI